LHGKSLGRQGEFNIFQVYEEALGTVTAATLSTSTEKVQKN
jgi:hypothetical protein